jgi:hypothetical protein
MAQRQGTIAHQSSLAPTKLGKDQQRTQVSIKEPIKPSETNATGKAMTADSSPTISRPTKATNDQSAEKASAQPFYKPAQPKRVNTEVSLPPMIPCKQVFPNTLEKNKDPALGGEIFTPPGCAGPMSYFNFYCRNTPASTPDVKIIPWDHNSKDYVYSAVSDVDFMQEGGRLDLKKRLDQFKATEFWDPVSMYNLSSVGVFACLVIALICIAIYIIVNPSSAKDNWYVLVVIPFAIVGLGTILFLTLRNRANKLTFQRKVTLDRDLENYSQYSAVKVRTGEASSYLELTTNPAFFPNQVTQLRKITMYTNPTAAPLVSQIPPSANMELAKMDNTNTKNAVRTDDYHSEAVKIVPHEQRIVDMQVLPQPISNSALASNIKQPHFQSQSTVPFVSKQPQSTTSPLDVFQSVLPSRNMIRTADEDNQDSYPHPPTNQMTGPSLNMDLFSVVKSKDRPPQDRSSQAALFSDVHSRAKHKAHLNLDIDPAEQDLDLSTANIAVKEVETYNGKNQSRIDKSAKPDVESLRVQHPKYQQSVYGLNGLDYLSIKPQQEMAVPHNQPLNLNIDLGDMA